MQTDKSNLACAKAHKMKCGEHFIHFDSPLLMGILNATPDSFYDGGNYTSELRILKRAEQILTDGADLIDIGACSSRPGAAQIDTKEELRRMHMAVQVVRKEFPRALLSLDTFRAEVAESIITEFGACIINDISGGNLDPNMFKTVGKLQVPYILMHMKGKPQTMQHKPVYNDLLGEITAFFKEKIGQLRQCGVKNIILDPGFGFGKSIEHNYKILAQLEHFCELKLPMLIGLSRKSMIYKCLNGNPESSLNGTTALHMIGLERGASILRVHDVKEAAECIRLHHMIQSQQ